MLARAPALAPQYRVWLPARLVGRLDRTALAAVCWFPLAVSKEGER
jgi:hypothetical protein